MREVGRLLITGALVYASMVAEALRAARNERVQRARGAIEPPGDVYSVMQVVYPGLFTAMIAEGSMRPEHGASPWFVAGLVAFALSKALKWWAILELGQFWTFRVIVVPGTVRVRSGPYRYLRHPNYVGVFGELVGTAFMTGALLTGPPAVLFFTGLMARRTMVEQGALNAAR